MRFDPIRKKLPVLIILVTLTVSAFFLARGTTSLLAGRLLPLQAGAGAPKAGRGAVPKAPGSETPDVIAILKRNIFDPETGPLWPPPREEPEADPNAEGEAEGPELAEGQLPPACEGSARLIAAVYSQRDPERSFASLANGSEPPLLYRKGSKFDDKEIDSIFPKAVFLRSGNGRLCSLGMFNELPKEAAAKATPAARPKPAPRKAPMAREQHGITSQDLEANITKRSDTSFAVQRGLVDKILENQAEIMRSARIVPHEQNGQVVGVKLYGIRRNSLLGQLGLQNGDLLRTINGYDMASPDSALEAYSRLRSASNLSVSVTRRGKPMTVEYEIE